VTVAAVPIDLWATTSQKGDGNQNFRCRFFLLLPFPSGSFYFIFVFQCYVEYAQLKKKKKIFVGKVPVMASDVKCRSSNRWPSARVC